MNMPQLVRSRDDRWIAGVAGGISRYLAVDPLMTRLVFIVLGISGVGPLVYLVLWLIMPCDAKISVSNNSPSPMAAWPPDPAGEIPVRTMRPGHPAPLGGQRKGTLGMILIIIGVFLFLSNLMPWIHPYVIPILLMIAGGVLIRRATMKTP